MLLGVVVPMAVLLALFVYADVFVMRSTAAPSPGSTALTIHVIGHQWFWEVRYPGTRGRHRERDPHPGRHAGSTSSATTADVIHCFWLPELNRKIDLIPGRTNRILLEADRPGRYRGQCSEFCGLQHAHMAVEVVAEPPAAFRAWLANQARAGARARDARAQRRGAATFLAQAVLGLPHDPRHARRSGDVGPDLTHVALAPHARRADAPERRPATCATGSPTRSTRSPATKMPALAARRARSVDALVAYLESLR